MTILRVNRKAATMRPRGVPVKSPTAAELAKANAVLTQPA
jgi:hypothetical protein